MRIGLKIVNYDRKHQAARNLDIAEALRVPGEVDGGEDEADIVTLCL